MARGPRRSRTGSITMLRSNPSKPSTAMPTMRNGIEKDPDQGVHDQG